jgi:hypothetical protein
MTHPRQGSRTARLLPLAFGAAIAAALSMTVPAHADPESDEPSEAEAAHLRDRGTGVPTSMFGTYVRKGELLVYPFVEFYADRNFEYKPSDLGYGQEVDHRGHYTASEQLLFVSYGITRDLAFEMEAAHISAELAKATNDLATTPSEFEETGLGDVEGQLRWRFLHEAGSRPEGFLFFETVLPLQRTKHLIGTQDWEWSLGAGVTRGYRWGTMTLRASTEYARDEGKFDLGEYAVEYQRRLTPLWKVLADVEGSQDETALVTEVQFQLAPRAVLKLNNGWGLTSKATDFAPEMGVMFSF